MDIEQPTINALVQHAQRQTKALESLRNYALVVLTLAGVGIALWLIGTFVPIA